MKFQSIAVFAAIAVFSVAVHGSTFVIDNCVRLDVEGTVVIEATQDGQTKFSSEIDLSNVVSTISGDCIMNDTSRAMTVHLNRSDSIVDWTLLFTTKKDSDNAVMDQMIKFTPNSAFNNSALSDEMVTVADIGNTVLSTTNNSFVCKAEQHFAFDYSVKGDYNYTAVQVLKNLQVQAFNLDGEEFSPAEECSADQNETTSTSTQPTTEVTTAANSSEPTTEPAATTAATTEAGSSTTVEPVPVPDPVDVVSFAVKDEKDVACFLLDAGLQVVVEYRNTKKNMVLSDPIALPGTASVNGTCSNGTDTVAVMTISADDVMLQITESATKDGEAASNISLSVNLDSANFPDAEEVNKTLTFEMGVQTFLQKSVTTYYLCYSEQSLEFNDTRTTLFANDVRLQAFNLKDGKFTGDGEECSLDPVTTSPPATTTPTPKENTYSVNNTYNNVTCIVMKGDIAFTNVVYNKTDGEQATAKAITIPRMNKTSENVKFSGSCAAANGTQQLVITFNGNWNLTLTFARESDETTSMLGAENDEYSLRDIQFEYVLTPEYFPNASEPNTKRTAKANNMKDFMKGTADGGSYKCDAKVTKQLDNGMEMETTNFQYKAFNDDEDVSLDKDVSECPADEESSNIVPIAVGVSLGGLVIIMIIAYLIGRRRRQKRGYDTL